MRIVAAKSILKANDQLAAENRARWTAQRVFSVNMVGSPGCGKTTLLEGMCRHLAGRLSPAVIEGDIAGQVDAERIARLGIPVVQINTDGMCHLDASLIAAAAADWNAGPVDLLFIENIGNLVCTAGYDLGEHLRIVILSVSEGDDKLVKYPAIFQRSHALVVTKLDLLPYTNFDLDRVRADMRRLAPEARVFPVAALRGDGLPEFAAWVTERRRALWE
jgi:hydrogenase nickel incorporation protein HypB